MRTPTIKSPEEWRIIVQKSGYSALTMAENLSISPRQLRRLVKAAFERSPQNWLDDQRLAASIEHLLQHRHVKLTAAAFGFKQASHFSRMFKKFYGFPPKVFLASGAGSEAFAEILREGAV